MGEIYFQRLYRTIIKDTIHNPLNYKTKSNTAAVLFYARKEVQTAVVGSQPRSDISMNFYEQGMENLWHWLFD